MNDEAREIEKAFQVLSMYGVPQERAKTVANGIEVLMTRTVKENVNFRQLLADVRAAITRIESYCGDIDCQRGIRNILSECEKIREHLN